MSVIFSIRDQKVIRDRALGIPLLVLALWIRVESAPLRADYRDVSKAISISVMKIFFVRSILYTQIFS